MYNKLTGTKYTQNRITITLKTHAVVFKDAFTYVLDI